jgi:hypothetical protein
MREEEGAGALLQDPTAVRGFAKFVGSSNRPRRNLV